MSEMDFAVMNLRVAMGNPKAIERRLVTEREREIKCKTLWNELAKVSTQNKKLRYIR